MRKETATWVDKEDVLVSELIKMIDEETIYIAYEGTKMIGFLTLYVPDQFIHFFFIDATIQGKGIGSQLLSAVEKDCHTGEMSLKCLIHNKNAIGFYEKKGFEISETHEETPATGYHVMIKTIK